MGWIFEMQTDLGLFPLGVENLEKARGSTRPDSPWTEQRRLFLIAEARYKNDEPPEDVLRVAHDADLAAAWEALGEARARLDPASTTLTGNLDLEEGRLHFAEDDNDETIRCAQLARENATFPFRSETYVVEAHARAEQWEHDLALEAITEALRIARLGPYPDREFDARLVAALMADNRGDPEQVVAQACRATELAHETNDRSQVIQAFLYLGFGSDELEDYVTAAEAFARGLDEMTGNQRMFAAELVCGLAGCLVHLGADDSAIRTLDEHEDAVNSRPHDRAYASAIRSRAAQGQPHATEFDASGIAEAELTAQVAFGLARLGALSPEVEDYFDQVYELLTDVGPPERLERFRRFRRDGWRR
jgi:tetratricopeptide (TPR) repeat protein